LAAAAVVNCERPLSTTDPITSVARVVISPHSVTLQPNELADFTAASFTAAGDSSPVGILWHATSGVVSDTGTTGHRHYGRYKNASCGDYLLIASNSPGWRSDSAKVAVRCPVAVASVAVSPASVALQVGQTVQLAATPQDTGGNPLAGRVGLRDDGDRDRGVEGGGRDGGGAGAGAGGVGGGDAGVGDDASGPDGATRGHTQGRQRQSAVGSGGDMGEQHPGRGDRGRKR